jgi:hypothetical protein
MHRANEKRRCPWETHKRDPFRRVSQGDHLPPSCSSFLHLISSYPVPSPACFQHTANGWRDWIRFYDNAMPASGRSSAHVGSRAQFPVSDDDGDVSPSGPMNFRSRHVLVSDSWFIGSAGHV